MPRRRRELTAKRHQSAGVARNEKASGFDRNRGLIEQLRAGRTACRRVHEHRVARQTAPANITMSLKQEYPEAVGNHDPLWSGAGFACTWQRLLRDAHRLRRRCSYCNLQPGEPARTGQSARPALRFPPRRRNAKASSVTNAPNTPRAGHPPDVPDQREAGDDGKEGGDEAGGAVLRHLDRLVRRAPAPARPASLRALLPVPESVSVR